MQGSKVHSYSFRHYEISLTPLTHREFDLSIFDKASRTEYAARRLTLLKIMVPALVKAFEQSRPEVRLDINVLEDSMKVQVVVASTFLLAAEETITLPKRSTVSEHEHLVRTLQTLERKFARF